MNRRQLIELSGGFVANLIVCRLLVATACSCSGRSQTPSERKTNPHGKTVGLA